MKISYCVVVIWLAITNQNEAVVVRINDGKVRGMSSLTRNSRNYFAFKGIPFAKPPVGDLRFRDPQPPIPWGERILDTFEDAPKCIQLDYFAAFDPQIEGNEDCLYLNVYTPRLSEKFAQELPVMVYIFYGGYLAGSGRSDYAGPEYLLDRDVVLVTINYRLNVFGFFSVGNDDAAGNWGMKDQAFALQWIQQNIAVFGGNKNQVTIFGNSAGASSVHLHMFSPISKGLFHRGISQSGSAFTFWALPNNNLQMENAKIQASFVGCNPKASSKNIVSCLRRIPANDLIESTRRFKSLLVEPTVIYSIVTENKTLLNPRPFLEKSPYDLLQNGQFNEAPWIFGIAEKEGLVKAGYILRNESYKNILIKNLEVNLPIFLGLPISFSNADIPLVYKKIVDFYLKGDTEISNKDSIEGFVDMTSDRFMIHGAHQSILLQAIKTTKPIWIYRYNYKSELTYTDHFSYTSNPVNGTFGVSHTDDLVPLFYSPAIFKRGLSSKNDMAMSYYMVQMWTSFAAYGNPSLNYHDLKFDWKPIETLYGRTTVSSSDISYLYMQGPSTNSKYPIKFEMRNDFFVERMRFWDNLGVVRYPIQVV